MYTTNYAEGVGTRKLLMEDNNMMELILLGYLRQPTICLKQKEMVAVPTMYLQEQQQYGPCHKGPKWWDGITNPTYLANRTENHVR